MYTLTATVQEQMDLYSANLVVSERESALSPSVVVSARTIYMARDDTLSGDPFDDLLAMFLRVATKCQRQQGAKPLPWE